MVTYFNKKDLVSFGTYLLSEERKRRFETGFKEKLQAGVQSPLSVTEALAGVESADLENWMGLQAKGKKKK